MLPGLKCFFINRMNICLSQTSVDCFLQMQNVLEAYMLTFNLFSPCGMKNQHGFHSPLPKVQRGRVWPWINMLIFFFFFPMFKPPLVTNFNQVFQSQDLNLRSLAWGIRMSHSPV